MDLYKINIFFSSCSLYTHDDFRFDLHLDMFRWDLPSEHVRKPRRAVSSTGLPHALALSLQDVALVELGQSDSDSDQADAQNSDSEDDSDSDSSSGITEQNLKLPGHKEKKKKVKIEVVSQ